MAKYEPLRRFLRHRRGDVVTLTYAEIERIIGAILPNAANSSDWWGNEASQARSRIQCDAWLGAGFVVADVEAGERVWFRRRTPSR